MQIGCLTDSSCPNETNTFIKAEKIEASNRDKNIFNTFEFSVPQSSVARIFNDEMPNIL